MHLWLRHGTWLLAAASLTVASCCKSKGGDDLFDPGLDEPGSGGETTPLTSDVALTKRKALGELPAPGNPAVAPKALAQLQNLLWSRPRC